MIRNEAAYRKLEGVLGSKIITRGRTLNSEGQPKQVFKQTLLLIPPTKAAALNITDGEVYIEKKTKEEFVAIVISQTKPRFKVKVQEPALPRNPMMEWRPVLGQGAQVKGEDIIIVCPVPNPTCKCREWMAQANVKLTSIHSLSSFKYGQVVTQLAVYEENERILKAVIAIRQAGSVVPAWWHPLAFVAATEADSVKLVSHSKEDGVHIQISTTKALAWNDDDDSSIHSTIPLNAHTPTKPVFAPLNINSKLRDALDIEFDRKFREFDARESK